MAGRAGKGGPKSRKNGAEKELERALDAPRGEAVEAAPLLERRALKLRDSRAEKPRENRAVGRKRRKATRVA